MTKAVDLGRKATKQTNKNKKGASISIETTTTTTNNNNNNRTFPLEWTAA